MKLLKILPVLIFCFGFAGCDNKDQADMVLKRSEQRLITAKEQCDGKVMYNIEHGTCAFCKYEVVRYRGFRCIPHGIEVVK